MTDKQIKVGQVWSTNLSSNSNMRIEAIRHDDTVCPIRASRLTSDGAIYETATYTRQGSFLESGDYSPYDLDKLLYDNEDKENPYDCGPEQEPTENIQEVLSCEEDLCSVGIDYAEQEDKTVIAVIEGTSVTLQEDSSTGVQYTDTNASGSNTLITGYKLTSVPYVTSITVRACTNGWIVVSDTNQYVFSSPGELGKFVAAYFTTRVTNV